MIATVWLGQEPAPHLKYTQPAHFVNDRPQDIGSFPVSLRARITEEATSPFGKKSPVQTRPFGARLLIRYNQVLTGIRQTVMQYLDGR